MKEDILHIVQYARKSEALIVSITNYSGVSITLLRNVKKHVKKTKPPMEQVPPG